MKKLIHFLGLALFLILISFFTAKSQVGTKITQTTLVEIKVNSVLHISCNGDKKGAINIMVSGGFPPYKYEWSNGATTQDIAGLAAGKYKVKVTDTNGCPDSLVVEVKEPPKLSVVIDSVQDILCYGRRDGRIDVTVTGGVSPYIYSWSDESSQEDLRSAEAGEYALLITDANHCQEITSATIKQNPLIVKSNEKVQNVACAGDSTGKIDINVNGGIPPYKFHWTSGERSEDLSQLIAGTYTVMVTDSRGCNEAYSTKVLEPEPIELKIDEVRHISCAGDKSGSISLSVKGGVKPYGYIWNDSMAFTQDLSGLTAGAYNLLVTDRNKCNIEFKQDINEPDKLVTEIIEVKDVLNYGGSDGAVYIDVTGGVKPYKYSWSHGAKSQDIANIPANNYTCRITDDNKCVNTISVNIKQPALLEVVVDEIDHIKCNGEKNGFINVTVKGGIAPYKFIWNNGATTKDIKGIGAGTYNLQVTDANGMQKTLKATVNEPPVLESNLQSVTNIDCNGDNAGSIDVFVKGGTAPYKYRWNNGSRKQDLTNVVAGDYLVQIVDKNQCVDSLTATIKENPLLEVSAQEVLDIKCFGKPEGEVSVVVKGGVEPYSFSWSNGAKTPDLTKLLAGKYTLKVADAKNCKQSLDIRIKEPPLLVSKLGDIIDVKCKGEATGVINLNISGGTKPYSFEWSDGAKIQNNENIKAGSYSVKIIDNKGCVNTLSATVNEPAKLISNVNKVVNVDCFGEKTGSIDISAAGGVGPYDYKWSNGATTQDIFELGSGIYSLVVKDQNQCTSELELNLEQNTQLVSTVKNVVHVNCNGFSTGAATVDISGGVTPYSFKWKNGAITKDLKNVKADKHVLTITDTKGCILKQEVVINEPPLFQGIIDSVKQIGCHGDSNAVILATFKGGVSPYSYKWSNGAKTKDIKNLKAGTYSIVATDKNGCKNELQAIINQPSKLELNLVSVENNLCNGERNGAIDISVKGGVTPYTYDWSNGATTQDQSGLEAGKYIVHVIGATGCEKSLEAEITQPQPLNLKIAKTTNVNCFGGNNGSIDLSVTGGKEPYSYSWSNGETTQDINTLTVGSYTVNVIDANECSATISAIINEPEELIANLADVKNINCFGESTGAISIDVKGGTTPYTYKWNNGKTTEDIDKLVVGSYNVEITDAKGCKKTLETKITQPQKLVSQVLTVENVLCNNVKEGSIDISVKGGVAPYIYEWSNGIKDQDLINVNAGKYTVKIQDANNCINNLEANILEPDMLVVSINKINDIKEFGSTNGSISISVSGGVKPYNYSWSNGAVSQNIENLVAGNYSVIVKDKNECRQDLNASISQPDAIEISIDSIRHIKCYGDSTGYALISAKGGVPPYSFKWDNGFVGKELKNVGSGKYALLITDANGAKKTKQIEIEQPEYFNLDIIETNNPTCYELNNGNIRTEVTGGTTPYNFAWNTGASTQDLKGLTSGSYVITVTDDRGCIQKDSTSLTKPDPLEVTLISTEHIKCFGEHKGKVKIDVKGGIAPYQYNWNHGAKNKDLDGIIAGNYNVKVIDANNCVQTVSTTVEEPPKLVAKLAEVKDVPCFGENKGSINTSVTGGVAPYRYSWNTGDSASAINNLYIGDYSVLITDANGCTNTLETSIKQPLKLSGFVDNVSNINCNGKNEGAVSIVVKDGTPPYKFGWSNGSKDQNLINILAGEYSVKVSDANGCEITLDATVTEPGGLEVSVDKIDHIKCFGENAGAIDVAVSGGVEPYKYSWSNGAATQDLLKIPAGIYSLNIQDAKGCVSIINATVEEPQPLLVQESSVNNIKCNGGTEGAITVSVTGGVEPYTYSWSNGSNTRDLTNVKAADYKLDVIDANGCKEYLTSIITEPPFLNKSIDAVKHISCNGESNGSISLSVSGGVVPYTYQWSNGATTQDLINVAAGPYSVQIKEGNGCASSLDVTIEEPTPFISELLEVAHNKCYGDENGSIKISAEGGTPPYSFEWTNGEVKQNLINIPSGDYSVLVSDANGCNHTIKTIIEQPDELVLTVDSARNVKCCGDTSGAIFITVIGGVTPYEYTWSHGATTEDITGLAQGQYSVVVHDANGCIVNTPEEGATIYEKIIAQGKFISRDILFDSGKASLKEESFIEISRIASFMKEHPQLRFSIEGHTDSQGDSKANMRLSEQRAGAIKESLVKFGINPNRLETKGMGESEPIDSNATAKGRANNRRVEFIPL